MVIQAVSRPRLYTTDGHSPVILQGPETMGIMVDYFYIMGFVGNADLARLNRIIEITADEYMIRPLPPNVRVHGFFKAAR